jgi:serine/threonine protein phosphatase PrpC
VIRVAGHFEKTDTGRQRQANEDALLARSPLFVVADGMGGAQAGEVASLTAVKAFEEGLPDGVLEQVLTDRIQVANRVIHDQAHSDPDLAGMGTTITAAVVDTPGDRVVIGHVGDSRAYRIRDGIIQRLTRDHSLVEEMRRRGQITAAEAEDHPQRSIITRALGPEPLVDVDVQAVPAEPGDLFLLCSDGLTSMLDDDSIRQVIVSAENLDGAVRHLIDAANGAGGRDNITALLFQVEDPSDPLPKTRPPARPPRTTEAAATGGGPSRGRKGLKVLVGAFATVAVVALIGFGVWFGSRQVWFLGTDDAGRVALYRGLPYELPFGESFYELSYSTAVQTAELPPGRQDVVTGHKLRSEQDAVDLIRDIEEEKGIESPQ